jgi:hypothetical protein
MNIVKPNGPEKEKCERFVSVQCLQTLIDHPLSLEADTRDPSPSFKPQRCGLSLSLVAKLQHCGITRVTRMKYSVPVCRPPVLVSRVSVPPFAAVCASVSSLSVPVHATRRGAHFCEPLTRDGWKMKEIQTFGMRTDWTPLEQFAKA